MTALAHKLAAFEIRDGDAAAYENASTHRLVLRATEDGWSLIAPGGQVVFRGFGLESRRQCLQFARDHGVLSVTG